LGSFEDAKHDSGTRIAKNRMVDPINVKVCIVFTKANPILDKVGS
jgi:hypothetical protein